MEHWSDLFPLIFLPFKIIVCGIGMYYAIKWHYDQEQKKKHEDEQQRLQSQQAQAAQAEAPVSNGPVSNGS